MKLRLLALLLAITTLVSCNKGYNRPGFYLSNPTNSEIKVTINDSTYTIAPHTFTVLRLENGINELEYKGQKTKFNVFKQNSGGIINPTQEPYYIYDQVYTVNGISDMFPSPKINIAIDGLIYTDNIQSTNALFIDNNLYNCTYFLDQKLLEEKPAQSEYSIRDSDKKFFTKEEFITFYETTLEDDLKGFHKKNKTENGECTITEPSTLELRLPDIPNQSTLTFYKKQIILLTEYKSTTDASRQRSIQKEVNDLSDSAFSSTHKEGLSLNMLIEKQDPPLEEFYLTTKKILGAGILQL